MSYYALQFSIVIIIAISNNNIAVAARNRNTLLISRESTWVWQCQSDDDCIRIDSNTSTSSPTYITQELCRLICGTYGPLWPRPNKIPKLGTRLASIDVSNIIFSNTEDSLLTQMQELFLREIRLLACGQVECSACNTNDCYNLNINFIIDNLNIKIIEWDINEGYSLEVSTSGSIVTAQITAATVFGARHAMQTLSQLMVQGNNGQILTLKEAQIINDQPIYTHRGVMLDTARHYLPISSIERTLDVMSTCKLNVLHLHLTDSHSFPFKSERVNQMSKYGAYSSDKIYTISDLNTLSQYALIRGIRIIPEIDAPAHAGNGWQWGPQENLGELAVCVNQQPWRDLCIQPPCGQLNPGNFNVYRILADIYKELKDALDPHTQTVFHMGGDEVAIKCWKSSDTVSNWLASIPGHEYLTDDDYHWAWKYFQDEALKSLDYSYNNTNPYIILWSSALTDPQEILQNLDPNRYVIQTWVPENETLSQDLINLGYKVIVSNKDAWYLDWGFWGITKYSSWKRVYEARLPDEALGGEVALWTELIDEYSMDSLLWPRSAALAERLWSNPPKSDKTNYAEARLLHWRKRNINIYKINPSAITPQWCDLNEGECQ